MTIRTARDVQAEVDDPGIAAVAILRLANDAVDPQTVTIGDDVYECDIADNGVTAGRLAVVPSDGTPANFSTALVAAINTDGTEAVTAVRISANEVLLYTSTAAGSGIPAGATGTGIALAETLAGASNAWDTAALRGGRAPGLQLTSQDVRVPNATEVALGNMHFIFPFVIEGALARVLVTATGVRKLWDGGVVISGKRVTLDNAGAGVKAQGTLTLDTNPTGGNTMTVGAKTYTFIQESAAVAAQGTLTVDANPTDADTFTIDAKTYVIQATLVNADGNIQREALLADTQQNIIDAINLTGTPGTQYAAAMTIHPTVSAATSWVSDDLVLTAKTAGVAGNTIATTETFFAGTNVFDAATLGTTRAGADAVVCPNVDGNIIIGATVADTQASLVAAFDLSGTGGVDYAAAMTAHPTVDIAAFASDDAVLTAKTAGAAGNSIVTTETFSAGTNVFDAATLGTTTAGENEVEFAATDSVYVFAWGA